MKKNLYNLRNNPLKPLISSNNDAIIYFSKRDILDDKVESINYIWNLTEVQKIINKQQQNGSWKSRTKKHDPKSGVNYDLIETWRQCRFLIDSARAASPLDASQRQMVLCPDMGHVHVLALPKYL